MKLARRTLIVRGGETENGWVDIVWCRAGHPLAGPPERIRVERRDQFDDNVLSASAGCVPSRPTSPPIQALTLGDTTTITQGLRPT